MTYREPMRHGATKKIRDRDDEQEEVTTQYIGLQGRGQMQLGSNGACERGHM